MSVYTDWNFLLCDHHHTVLPSDGDGRQSSLVDGFEGILWRQEEEVIVSEI